MPTLKKKPTTAAASNNGDSEVLYPEPTVALCLGDDAVGIDEAKQLLGWEAEDAYTARMMKDNPKLKEAACKYGEDYLFLDENGKKVRCWRNDTNRPFTESWAKTLAQDILNHNWRFNFENIIVSRTGKIQSGQHRLVGLVIAHMWWQGKQKHHWQELWPTAPTIETSIGYGADESAETLRTIDNVKPRMLSDVVYTSSHFHGLSSVERKECSRMLGAAIDLLWKRTGAGDDFTRYQTHSESINWLDRHPKLEQCVKTIFDENKERAISKLKLSPGMCSGLLYLMGSCGSDGDDYKLADPAPNEKALSWDHWETAVKFWKDLGTGKDMMPVRIALAGLASEEGESTGTTSEKKAVLIKAWEIIVGGSKLSAKDLALEYRENDDGTKTLTEHPVITGIDLGESKAEAEEPVVVMTDEQLAAKKVEERKRRAEQATEKIKKLRADKEATAKGIQPKSLMSRKQVEQEQTRRAAEADALAAKEREARTAAGKSGTWSKGGQR